MKQELGTRLPKGLHGRDTHLKVSEPPRNEQTEAAKKRLTRQGASIIPQRQSRLESPRQGSRSRLNRAMSVWTGQKLPALPKSMERRAGCSHRLGEHEAAEAARIV
jgi:hypothetical protein